MTVQTKAFVVVLLVLGAALGITAADAYSALGVVRDREATLSQLDADILRLQSQTAGAEENTERATAAAADLYARGGQINTYLDYVKGRRPWEAIWAAARAPIAGRALENALENYRVDLGDASIPQGAEEVYAVYRYICSNVDYGSDNDEYGQAEVYAPPTYLLSRIENGERPKADCEDQAILFATLVSRMILDHPDAGVSLKELRVKEAVLHIPTDITVFEFYYEGAWYRWAETDWAYVGHAWAEVEFPDLPGYVKRVVFDPTVRTADNSIPPWDLNVPGSDAAEQAYEEGFFVAGMYHRLTHTSWRDYSSLPITWLARPYPDNNRRWAYPQPEDYGAAGFTRSELVGLGFTALEYTPFWQLD